MKLTLSEITQMFESGQISEVEYLELARKALARQAKKWGLKLLPFRPLKD